MKLFFENILAARGRDLDKFLPFIIVAVVIIVNLVKVIARGVKSMSQQDGFESKSVRPQKPSKYLNTADSYKTLEQMREEKIAQIKATFGIPSPPLEEFEEPEEELYIAPAVVAPPPVPVPQRRPVVVHRQKRSTVNESLPEHHTDKAFSWKPAVKPAGGGVKKVSADIGDFCFSSPNDLRKAVVYQEILGKPVSLRD